MKNLYLVLAIVGWFRAEPMVVYRVESACRFILRLAGVFVSVSGIERDKSTLTASAARTAALPSTAGKRAPNSQRQSTLLPMTDERRR